MLTSMRLKNFKCWQDTGDVELAPLTLLFGANSSGKSSLIQALLLLKQSANSRDRKQILNFGSKDDPVRLGSFENVIIDGDITKSLEFALEWKPRFISEIDLENKSVQIDKLRFENEISQENYPAFDGNRFQRLRLNEFRYIFNGVNSNPISVGMRSHGIKYPIVMIDEGFGLRAVKAKDDDSEPNLALESPNYYFSFPEKLRTQYQNTDWLFELEYDLNTLINSIYYLGPLRSEPERFYSWSSGQGSVNDLDYKGENAIKVLLADRAILREIKHSRLSSGREITQRPSKSTEEIVAGWLKQLGLIESFKIIHQSEDIYKAEVQVAGSDYIASLVDVGFGISQILPVLVLCASAPSGTTILLEQPEMHLHPKAQSLLADVFIDAINKYGVQIIVESHSEHLLTRLQRRMAENGISDAGISSEHVRTYFCERRNDRSVLTPLELNEYGYITNWPKDFFGDELDERTKMFDAMMERQQTNVPA